MEGLGQRTLGVAVPDEFVGETDTTGASVTTSRQLAIEIPDAASQTATASTATVSTINSRCSTSAVRSITAYSRYTEAV